MKSAGICCGVKPYFFKVFLSFKYEINLALSRNKQDETFLAKFVVYFYTHFGYNLFEGLSEKDLGILDQYEKVLPLGSLYKSIRNKIRKFLRPLLIYTATPKELVAFLQMFLPRKTITPVMYFLTKTYQSRN